MNRHVRQVAAVIIAVATLETAAAIFESSDTIPPAPSPAMQFLPEILLSANIRYYLFQKNDYFRKTCFLGTTIAVEPAWFSYKRLLFFTAFDVNPDMGRKGLANVLFDPMAINFAITTIFEFRPRSCIVQIGEDHRCFHEIDRKEFPTVYWNMLYAVIASRSMRPGDYGPRLFAADTWSISTRLAWQMRWGVFVKSFFGLVKESNIDYENNRVHETEAWARYAVYKWRKSAVCISSLTRAGVWKAGAEDGGGRQWYWRQEMAAAGIFYSGGRGCELFVNYILDDIPLYRGLPRFSKDRLLELGVKVFR